MDQPQTVNYNKWLYLFIGVAVVINFSGICTTIMGPDATLYASIAKTMVQRNNYVELFAFGTDWLDKPHFPFWITAFSFKLLGISTWAYKLPAICFLLMGVWYTYLFAKALYNEHVALWSVLILLTAQHIILSNNDVRAEPYLTGLVIASVHHFYKSYTPITNWWHLLAGCIFTACAIMTKGMFSLIPIGGAVVGHFIITKQWSQLFNWRWLIAAILILLFILPEIYCLYQQFDLHPEKVVFGDKGVSGIKFFFWDSQFGRFFNTGPIKGHGDPSFFIHTTLWAFLPWSLLLFAGIYQFFKKGIKNIHTTEWYCICGSLLTFLLFSASKFQLPHYLNIVFPFFAIITAWYLSQIKNIKTIRIVQAVVMVLMMGAISALHYFFDPDTFSHLSIFLMFVFFFALLFLSQRITSNPLHRLIFQTLLTSFIVNVYLNQVFYPNLAHYQSGSEAAIWLNHHNPKKIPLTQIDDHYATAMEFYSDEPVINLNPNGTGKIPGKPFVLYASSENIASLKKQGWNIKPIKTFQRYWVSRLKPAFLNHATRKQELGTTELVLVAPPNPPE